MNLETLARDDLLLLRADERRIDARGARRHERARKAALDLLLRETHGGVDGRVARSVRSGARAVLLGNALDRAVEDGGNLGSVGQRVVDDDRVTRQFGGDLRRRREDDDGAHLGRRSRLEGARDGAELALRAGVPPLRKVTHDVDARLRRLVDEGERLPRILQTVDHPAERVGDPVGAVPEPDVELRRRRRVHEGPLDALLFLADDPEQGIPGAKESGDVGVDAGASGDGGGSGGSGVGHGRTSVVGRFTLREPARLSTSGRHDSLSWRYYIGIT